VVIVPEILNQRHIPNNVRRPRKLTSRAPIYKIHRRALLQPPRLLKIFNDVIRPHSKTRRRSLLQRRPRKAPIQPHDSILAQYHLHRMYRAAEPPLPPSIIDQRRLDPLRRRHRQDGRQHARAHPRKHVPGGGQRARHRVLEGVLHAVETEEAHRILTYATDDQHAATFVQRAQALAAIHARQRGEGVARRARMAELDTSLGVLEGVGDACFNLREWMLAW
jgi:hypothetical protein